MSDLTFGVIGVGQAGVNIANVFAEKFPAIALDTHQGNLNELDNIGRDVRLHMEISSLGGAGKDPRKGAKAIKKYKKEILDLIKSNLGDCNYIWITGGLGGGTGTPGVPHLSYFINNHIKKDCGIIATIPPDNEGTDELSNAETGLSKIEDVRQRGKYLKSVMLVENEKLKNKMLNDENSSYEEVWEKGNHHIFNLFNDVYQFTKKDSKDTMDGEDLMRILAKSGYVVIARKQIDIDNTTDQVLINEINSIWQENIFVEKLEYNKAKGLGIIVNRPKSYSGDGQQINKLLHKVNDFIGSGTLARGIYSVEESFTEKLTGESKPLELYVALSGMPFPGDRFSKLQEEARKQREEYLNKGNSDDIDLDVVDINNYLDADDGEEEINFSMFDEDEGLEDEEIEEEWDLDLD